MKSIHNSKRNLSFLIGAMVLLAGASIVIGQTSPTDEYDEWQKAEREAVREHREYLNNPKRSNYLDWRSAQRDAQREHEEYLLALEVQRRHIKGGGKWYVAESDARDEYEEWKAAQREAVRERIEYTNNPTTSNYKGWQDAVADEHREYAEYRAVAPVAAYRTAAYTRTTSVRRHAPVRHVRRKRVCHCS